MEVVKYPHHVKANGRYYAPGEAVEIDDFPDGKKDQSHENSILEKPKATRGKKTE